jgi:hypothetical protein
MRLRRKAMCAVATLAGTVTLGIAGSAQATPAPHWLMISQPAPTYFHAGDKSDFYWIVAMNDGGAATTGKLTFKDTLPGDLIVTAAEASAGNEQIQFTHAVEMECTTTGGVSQTVECTTESSVPIGHLVIARIDVEVPEGTSGPLENTAMITGGGAPEEASTSNSTPVVDPSTTVPYGVSFTSEATQEDGRLARQAGSHPFAFSTQLAANVGQVNAEESGGSCKPPNAPGFLGCPEIAATPKDIEVQLPPGFVGNPLAVPRCNQRQFQAGGNDGCPASTQVGDLFLAFFGPGTAEQYAPVYNVAPPPGQPAELGATVGGAAHVPMFFHLRSDGNYGLTVDISKISTFDAVRLASLMTWGMPAAAVHDSMRESAFNGCESGVKGGVLGCPSEALPAKPFLTMPGSCSRQALGLPLMSDSWQAPGVMVSASPEATLPPVRGCKALSFSPELGLSLSTSKAQAPAGYTVHLKMPQHEAPEELATPEVRNVEVTLPEGTEISPSTANGLVACTDEQFGRTSGMVGKCPPQSKVGTVTVRTPVLLEPVEGSVYVGQPECTPCTPSQVEEGKMVRLFIEAKLPEPPPEAQRPAVLVKLAGHTKVNKTTGQLTTVFTDNPQLPFDELEVALDEGAHSPLTNPSACGPAVAVARLTPWSRDVVSSISATGAPSIEGCYPPAFTPSLIAGMTGSRHGGAFGSFEVSLTRPDGQRDLGTVALHTPPGLAGLLAKVPPCGEAEANAGSCSGASQIGEVSASVGSGAQPYTIHGGRVFLTGPYGGGSFGLSLVVPAAAGPYHLSGIDGSGGEGNGNVVVRGSIKVNPKTATLTITTNPPPTRLDGIPLHIQKVFVNVNRAGFMFNPTNCDHMSIQGTLTSSTGTTFTTKYPFQATDCAKLPFKPGFFVSTRAGHTRKNGAYLHVRVTSGSGQANIKSVFVELPKILPSRVSTLKQACTEAQFATNPAGCPAGSFVGTAVARTPVLPVPLTGPAIFVSHGGAAFPDLAVVLQGDNVTVDLTGSTNIRNGVTSSAFKSVPDVPVSSFELTAPQGPHSALAAIANLCTKTVSKHHKHVKQKRRLRMPTTITGQNGAVIKRSTMITVAGCRKAAVKPGGKKHHKK